LYVHDGFFWFDVSFVTEETPKSQCHPVMGTPFDENDWSINSVLVPRQELFALKIAFG
jgi:hypothetical protein